MMVNRLIVIDEVTQAVLKMEVYEEMGKIETDLDEAKVAYAIALSLVGDPTENRMDAIAEAERTHARLGSMTRFYAEFVEMWAWIL